MILENKYENLYWSKNQLVIGIDEVGRGPICGPLVVCGVVLPINYQNEEIFDSKKVSEKKRLKLFKQIINDALYYDLRIVEPDEIDRLNIYRATQKAMEEIAMKADVSFVVTDAMKLTVDVNYDHIIKGDQKSISIAASSIVAKVVRDRIMDCYSILYPEYGFEHHKGYPTKKHLEAIEKYGLKSFYRLSYSPCQKINEIKLDI